MVKFVPLEKASYCPFTDADLQISGKKEGVYEFKVDAI